MLGDSSDELDDRLAGDSEINVSANPSTNTYDVAILVLSSSEAAVGTVGVLDTADCYAGGTAIEATIASTIVPSSGTTDRKPLSRWLDVMERAMACSKRALRWLYHARRIWRAAASTVALRVLMRARPRHHPYRHLMSFCDIASCIPHRRWWLPTLRRASTCLPASTDDEVMGDLGSNGIGSCGYGEKEVMFCGGRSDEVSTEVLLRVCDVSEESSVQRLLAGVRLLPCVERSRLQSAYGAANRYLDGLMACGGPARRHRFGLISVISKEFGLKVKYIRIYLPDA